MTGGAVKMIGKRIRMERILDRRTGNAVIVPMDHGITSGPSAGLFDVRSTVEAVAAGGATAVLMHKGLVECGHRGSFRRPDAGADAANAANTANTASASKKDADAGCFRDLGLILHLSASTDIGPSWCSKVLVSTVEEAVRLGADAVSVHVNFGSETESQMLSDLGKVSEECAGWGMPLLAMAYPRGPGISDPEDPDLIAHCARACAELGADIIKVSYTGDIDSFREVVRGTPAPVLIAGGPNTPSDTDLLRMVEDAMKAGGRGVSIGRNIFSHRNIEGITKAVSGIVLEGLSAEEAGRLLTDD